jgi:hypothetical protein
MITRFSEVKDFTIEPRLSGEGAKGSQHSGRQTPFCKSARFGVEAAPRLWPMLKRDPDPVLARLVCGTKHYHAKEAQ